MAPEIKRVWDINMRVYGADKVWKQMEREPITIARCTLERLMRRMGVHGVIRGTAHRTTYIDSKTAWPLDHVNRQFNFVVDVFARRIVGV